MIKIDYEGCWKEFKATAISLGIYTESELLEFEKHNTRNFIELKRREPEDRCDYLTRKYLEKHTELIELKRKIKDLLKGVDLNENSQS